MEMLIMKEIDENNKSFEEIKHIDENGILVCKRVTNSFGL